MASKISTEKKLQYQEGIKDYKNRINDTLARINKFQEEAKSNEKLVNYYFIASANEYLNICNIYISMNALCMNVMKSKNEGFLNESRKYYFNALIELEKVFSNYIDTDLTENDKILKTITHFDPDRQLNLVKKFGYTLSMIEDGFGTNSKWKWSFVDMEGRYVTILKNMINWKKVGSNNDPRMPYYEEREVLTKMVKELLKKASERARQKYELSTHEIEDMRKGVGYLNALRRIHAVFGESEQAEVCKKTAGIWNEKLESDIKAKDKKRKTNAATNKTNKKKKKKKSFFG